MSPGLSLQTGLAEYRRVAAVAGNSGIQSLRPGRDIIRRDANMSHVKLHSQW